MKNWDRTFRHLGEVKENTEYSVDFTYTGDKTIKEYKPSCNCISCTRKDNTLTLKFKTINIPELSKQHGRYYSEVVKTVTVIFDDNTNQELIAKAAIIANEDL